MPALNFQNRFADAVARKKKRHTIRARRKHPIKAGDTLYLYTGMRTKKCRRLCEPVRCTAATAIVIVSAFGFVWLGAGSQRYPRGILTPEYVTLLALADGFASAGEFFAWFADTHGSVFEGYLIEWE